MIVWTRFGFLAVITGVGGLTLTQSLINTFMNDAMYYSVNAWPKLLGAIVAALLTYLLQFFLKDDVRSMIDKETGMEVEIRSSHTLFWIPIRFWPYLMLAFGVIIFLSEVLASPENSYADELTERLKNATKQEQMEIISKELDKIRREELKNQLPLEEVTARAENGDIAAQVELGERYLNAKGVKKNNQKAYEWYREAADAGNPEAQYWVGYIFEWLVIDMDEDERLRWAMEWYRESAEAGYSHAQFTLGYCYQTGKGVKKDLKAAAFWYEKASLNQHHGAMACLGLLFAEGKGGVKKDAVLGMAWELASQKILGEPGSAYEEQFNSIWKNLNEQQRVSAKQISIEIVKRMMSHQ